MKTDKKLPSKASITTFFALGGVFLTLIYVLAAICVVRSFNADTEYLPIGVMLADVLFLVFTSIGGLQLVKRCREQMKWGGTLLKVYSIVQFGVAGMVLFITLILVVISCAANVPQISFF